MISAPSQDPAPAAPAAIRPERLDTHEQARPVPYLAGEDWFPVTWITRKVHDPILISRGKQEAKKGGGHTTYTAGGSVMGLVCLGPVDFIDKLEIAGKVEWQGYFARGESNPHFAGGLIPNVVGWRLYWGTEDQPADDLVVPHSGEQHPRYLGFCYLVLKNLSFGPAEGTVTPPNVRVHIGRAARFPGLDEGLTREGTNPITTLAEVTGNGFYGLGRPDLVNVATAAPLATAVKRPTTVTLSTGYGHVAQMGYVSVKLDQRAAFGAFAGGVLENIDGWIRRKGAQLEFGVFPHDGAEPAGLLELSLHDFVDDPRFDNPGPDHESVITEAIVRGPDREWDMDAGAESWPNSATLDRLGETRQRTFERPLQINSYQRLATAQRLSVIYARPEQKIEGLRIRREKLQGRRAGDLCIINYGPSRLRQVFRITRLSDPADGGEVEISLLAERGLAPLGYVAVPDPVPTLPEPPHPEPIVHARVFQFPFAGEYGAAPTIAILAERPDEKQARFGVHYSVDDQTYDLLATVTGWALHGTLAGAIAAGTTTLTIAATGPDVALLEAQSASAAADDTLLLFVDGEVMSIGDVVALGEGQYEVAVLRGRRHTIAADHAEGADVFIVARAAVVPLQHAGFPLEGGTRYFKLASGTATEDQELAAALKLTYTLAPVLVAPPTGMVLIAGDDPNTARPPPSIFGNSGQLAFACTIRFTPSKSPRVVRYFVNSSAVDDPVGATLGFDFSGPEATTSTTEVFYYALSDASARYLYIRSMTDTGALSDWARIGDCAPYLRKPSGDMVEQNGNAVAITGGSATGLSVVSAVEVIETSSRRYKRNIRSIFRPLTLLRKLQGIRFDHRQGRRRGRIGLEAEHTRTVLPSMVGLDKDGRPDGIDYGPIVALVIEGLKQHERENAREFAALKKRLATVLRLLRRSRRRPALLQDPNENPSSQQKPRRDRQ